MEIPNLEPVERHREYDAYSEEQRDKVIYNWLFSKDQTHRTLDQTVLGFDSDYSKGYQSMGILHHLGLTKNQIGIWSI